MKINMLEWKNKLINYLKSGDWIDSIIVCIGLLLIGFIMGTMSAPKMFDYVRMIAEVNIIPFYKESLVYSIMQTQKNIIVVNDYILYFACQDTFNSLQRQIMLLNDQINATKLVYSVEYLYDQKFMNVSWAAIQELNQIVYIYQNELVGILKDLQVIDSILLNKSLNLEQLDDLFNIISQLNQRVFDINQEMIGHQIQMEWMLETMKTLCKGLGEPEYDAQFYADVLKGLPAPDVKFSPVIPQGKA